MVLYFDSAKIITAEIIPPTKAHPTTTAGSYIVMALAEDDVPCIPAPRHIIPMVAPNEAPCDTPSVEAEARGLRRTLCITLPDIASSIPTSTAVTILGILILNTIELVIASPLPRKQENIRESVSPDEPEQRENNPTARHIKNTRRIMYFLRLIYDL